MKLNPNKINRNSLYIKFLNQSICVLSIFSFSIKSKYSDLMERIKNDPELCRRLGLKNEDDKKKRNGKQE